MSSMINLYSILAGGFGFFQMSSIIERMRDSLIRVLEGAVFRAGQKGALPQLAEFAGVRGRGAERKGATVILPPTWQMLLA